MKNVLNRACAFGAVALCSTAAFAQSGPTLPSTGIDVGDYITLGITGMGVVAGVAVGGYVAFKIIKKALAWTGRALG